MMKKTLIAMAALAATSAFAQSSVSIVGFIDSGYKNTRNDTQALKRSEISLNGTGTTAIHFRGVEDLGGGMKALFQAEIDWNPTQSSTLNGAPGAQFYAGTPFNGEQFLGLSGGFGSVKLGSPNGAGLETNAVAQPFGTALGGGFSSTVSRLGVTGLYGINQYVGGPNANNRIIRHEKTVRYDTPDLSGFGASVEYSFANANAPVTAGNTGNANNNNKYQAIGLKYSNGPLNVRFSNTKATADNVNFAAGSIGAGGLTVVNATNLAPVGSVTSNYLAANYTFGAATVYGGYTTTRTSTSSVVGAAGENANSYNIAGKYAVSSQVALMANYVVIKDKRAAGFAIDHNRKILGLGADYRLSARTALYARFEGYDNGAASTATTGPKQSVYMIGVNHSF